MGSVPLAKRPSVELTLYAVKYSELYFTWNMTEKQGVCGVSFVVARMQKLKADNLVGLGNHDQRKTANHSNQDIDVSRSHLNYDLVAGRTNNFKTDIQGYINEHKTSQRAVRKDAVLANEWIITSDKGFFEQLDEKQTRTYFETVKQYFADKFGDENIRYAIVHLDEHTPHMHMGIVPFDEDNKLSAKRVFNREALQKVQDELPEFLQAKGFEIERGQKNKERKNLSVPEYKAMRQELETVKADTKKQRQEFEDFKKSDFDVTNVETLQPRFKKGYVLVKKDDFEQMKQGAIYSKVAFVDSLHAKSDAERYHDNEIKASSRASELELKNDKLQAENNKLRTQLNHAQDLIKHMFKVLKEKLGDKVHMKLETWHKVGLKAPNEPDKQPKKHPERNTELKR